VPAGGGTNWIWVFKIEIKDKKKISKMSIIRIKSI
jgi:hypothetical protein